MCPVVGSCSELLLQSSHAFVHNMSPLDILRKMGYCPNQLDHLVWNWVVCTGSIVHSNEFHRSTCALKSQWERVNVHNYSRCSCTCVPKCCVHSQQTRHTQYIITPNFPHLQQTINSAPPWPLRRDTFKYFL